MGNTIFVSLRHVPYRKQCINNKMIVPRGGRRGLMDYKALFSHCVLAVSC